jgi:hypothetical protein
MPERRLVAMSNTEPHASLESLEGTIRPRTLLASADRHRVRGFPARKTVEATRAFGGADRLR